MPPVTTPMETDPLFWPHVASVGVICTAVAPPVLLIFIVVENEQPLASLTAMVCEPAGRFVKLVVLLYPPPSIEYS